MSEPLRGVNLGGWLVLEKWITPSVFAATNAEDEYAFMKTEGAREKLDKHRKTFISESDFKWLATHDINAVRIPVGYWILTGAAPYTEGAEYLDWAFAMCKKYHLRVLLDLHGLPGSQNGNDHSGRIGKVGWQQNRGYQAASLVVLEQFAERYGEHPALWGVEIINEPNPGALQLPLRRFYRRAYKLLVRHLPARVKIVYSDAWSPRIFAFALPFRRHAVMDVHLYHMATVGAKAHSLEWYYRKMTRRIRILRLLARLHPIVIGEWSGVISGETIGKLSKDEQDRLQQLHYDFQREAFSMFAGTFMWTYKTEGTGLNFWSYRSVAERS